MQYILYSLLALLILTITYPITPFIFLIAFILMCAGLYEPKWVIWSKNEKRCTRLRVMKWYGTISCIAIILVGARGLNPTETIRPTITKPVVTLPQTDEKEQLPSEKPQIDGIRPLEIHFIDVGQGDAILVSYGDFEMLIDGGDNKYGNAVVAYLEGQGVDTIDYLIGTHMDADHIGGLDDVLEAFEVLTIIDSGTSKNTKTYRDYWQAVQDEGAIYMEDEMMQITIDDFLSLQIIETGDDYKDENDNSVVVQVNYLDTKILFAGDMEKEAEEASIHLFEDVAILKSAHHGSRTSSSLEILEQMTPEYVVISCGQGNKYGHPHQETLDRYEAFGMEIYRTDLHGTVVCTISPDGSIGWETEKSH